MTVHFLCDEISTFGHMEQLDDALDKYRGYGVRLMLFFQSIGQIKKCFPEGQDQTLLANVSQVFFGVSDPQTAEYVSSRLGEETIVVSSGGVSQGDSLQHSTHAQESRSRSRNGSENWQQTGRKLLKPEEVSSLPDRTAITFIRGSPPICTTLTRYFENENSLWRSTKQAVGMLVMSVCLFMACVMVAVALAKSLPRQIHPVNSTKPSVMRPADPVDER